jgi:hypothetical protein
MTSRVAIAVLPRHRAPIGDPKVIPFPRRPRRHGDGSVTHGRGGPGGGRGGPSDQIDTIIRRTWGLHCAGEMSEDAAGELHDKLNSLRENFANSREGRWPE